VTDQGLDQSASFDSFHESATNEMFCVRSAATPVVISGAVMKVSRPTQRLSTLHYARLISQHVSALYVQKQRSFSNRGCKKTFNNVFYGKII